MQSRYNTDICCTSMTSARGSCYRILFPGLESDGGRSRVSMIERRTIKKSNSREINYLTAREVNRYRRKAFLILFFLSSDVVASLEDDEPNEESAGEEGQDAGRDLEAPREPKTVVVWVASSNPKVLTLQTKSVIGKHHDGHHEKNTWKNT